ncbi:hypothetical protein [Dyella silvatica]|uniref:hypothetical protein n=1 Tax=Dyella silvatica TaxID=2992128 RepID=UPI002258CF24|nr:hypothetical protein [Dyella silvatica]
MIRFTSTLRTIISIGVFIAVFNVYAATPRAGASDLGKTNPQAEDLSISPNWHVYVFHRDGIKYIQVNDQQDQVRVAFATGNGSYLVLPIGSDAHQVSTPQRRLPFHGAATLSETVYTDNAVQVVMAPQSGGVQWQVQPVAAPINARISSTQGSAQVTASTCKVLSCGGDFLPY